MKQASTKETAEPLPADYTFFGFLCLSIVPGIFQGRLIYENLKKSIQYTLTHIAPEVLALILFATLQIPLPITPILILMIDFVSELGPAMSYSTEPPEVNLMDLTPQIRPSPHRYLETQKGYILLKPFRTGSQGESLVDASTVMWAYFQGGIILTIGCFGAYVIVFATNYVPLYYLWRGAIKHFNPYAPVIILSNGAKTTVPMQQTIQPFSSTIYVGH